MCFLTQEVATDFDFVIADVFDDKLVAPFLTRFDRDGCRQRRVERQFVPVGPRSPFAWHQRQPQTIERFAPQRFGNLRCDLRLQVGDRFVSVVGTRIDSEAVEFIELRLGRFHSLSSLSNDLFQFGIAEYFGPVAQRIAHALKQFKPLVEVLIFVNELGSQFWFDHSPRSTNQSRLAVAKHEPQPIARIARSRSGLHLLAQEVFQLQHLKRIALDRPIDLLALRSAIVTMLNVEVPAACRILQPCVFGQRHQEHTLRVGTIKVWQRSIRLLVAPHRDFRQIQPAHVVRFRRWESCFVSRVRVVAGSSRFGFGLLNFGPRCHERTKRHRQYQANRQEADERHRPAVVQTVRADTDDATHAGEQRAVGGSKREDSASAAQLFDG